MRHFGRVLGRQHDRVDAHRLVTFVLDRDLALRVGTQPLEHALLAQLGLLFDEAVRVVDRERHQVRRFIAREAEHQALVASALLLVQALACAHTLADVGRLTIDGDHHGARVAVDAEGVIRVADALERVARDFGVVDLRLGRDLTCDNAQTGGDERFAGHAAVRVLREDRVENGVGDLVGHLVGVTHGYAFRSEEMTGHAVGRVFGLGADGGPTRASIVD